MEKVSNKIAALAPDAHFFSLEYFPPKTQAVIPLPLIRIFCILTV
jgi:hypothetical protein